MLLSILTFALVLVTANGAEATVKPILLNYNSVIHNAHGSVMILTAQQSAIQFVNLQDVTQVVQSLKTQYAM
jgi:hypothetical protein